MLGGIWKLKMDAENGDDYPSCLFEVHMKG